LLSRKKILTACLALVALVFILVWTQGGFHPKVPGGITSPPGKRPSDLKTIKAETGHSGGEVTVSGTVVSRETARVASRVLGYVVELNVDAGDTVKKGQVLLRIDAKDMAEREAQTRAALESAHADLVKTRNDYERYKSLFEKESVAKKDYDDALARYEMSQAAEQRAAAALEEAKTQLSYAIVTAPFDGIVSGREINLGDLATPGKALLSIYMPGTLELVAAIGEQYAPYVRLEEPVTITIPSAKVEQTSKIREVVPQRDERTRTITVKAPLSEHPGLGPGLYGTLTFKTVASDVVLVPADAVQSVGQLETVKVLESGLVKIRHVKTGRKLSDGKVEIISGLNPGEEVVVK
jgi:RND family efflux transporter MFP subunit